MYLLTHDCGRFTANIASVFEDSILVPDVRESLQCTMSNWTLLRTNAVNGATADEGYKQKYSLVLEDCYEGSKAMNDGGKMKCLILEDDIIFLHDAARTKEILVENTLSLFNKEDSAYDCTKRGFGWLPTSHTGMGSQCRLFSRLSADCMSKCIKAGGDEQLDFALKSCQAECGLVQKRFLLAVHGGLVSTMGRASNE